MLQTPFSKNALRFLKSQKDEAGCQLKIDEIIRQIYNNVIQTAERKTETVYMFDIGTAEMTQNILGTVQLKTEAPPINGNLNYYSLNITHEDIFKNKDAILNKLSALFPECRVEHKRKRVFIKKNTKSTDKVVDKNNETQSVTTNDFIVVDWS